MSFWSMHGFARRQAGFLGIDLGPEQAILVRCSRGLRTWRIDQCAVSSMPAQGLQGERILQFESLASLLRDLVTSAGPVRRIALALPPGPWRQVLDLPAGLRPWAWRRWLQAQAEQLARSSAPQLVWGAELVQARPPKVLLSVHPLELVQDWQGLAEAAGLSLVLLDDRPRVMLLALRALGLAPFEGRPVVLAEIQGERCVMHRWQVGQAPEVLDGGTLEDMPDVSVLHGRLPPAQGAWVCGPPGSLQAWLERLPTRWGGSWSALDPLGSPAWHGGNERPGEVGSLLAALGLALRAWRS
jgi:hypothetical protein